MRWMKHLIHIVLYSTTVQYVVKEIIVEQKHWFASIAKELLVSCLPFQIEIHSKPLPKAGLVKNNCISTWAKRVVIGSHCILYFNESYSVTSKQFTGIWQRVHSAQWHMLLERRKWTRSKVEGSKT